MSTKTKQTKTKPDGNFIKVDKNERAATHYVSFTDGSHVKLNNNKLAVLHTMLDQKKHWDDKGNEYFDTQEHIAAACNVSTRLVEETVREFVKHGILVILRRFTPAGWPQNVYVQVNRPKFIVPGKTTAQTKETTKLTSKPASKMPAKAHISPVDARLSEAAPTPHGIEFYDEIEPFGEGYEYSDEHGWTLVETPQSQPLEVPEGNCEFINYEPADEIGAPEEESSTPAKVLETIVFDDAMGIYIDPKEFEKHRQQYLDRQAK